MESLLARVLQGEEIPAAEMQKEGPKHLFMELLELIRIEDMNHSESIRFKYMVRALQDVIMEFPTEKRGIFVEDAMHVLLRKTQMDRNLDIFLMDFIDWILNNKNVERKENLRQTKALLEGIFIILERNLHQLIDCVDVPSLITSIFDYINRMPISLHHIFLSAQWKKYANEWLNIVLPARDDLFHEEGNTDDEMEDIKDELHQLSKKMAYQAMPDPYHVKYLGIPSFSETGLAVLAYWYVLSNSGKTTIEIKTMAPHICILMIHSDSAVKRAGIRMLDSLLNAIPHGSVDIYPEIADKEVSEVVGLDRFAQLQLGQHHYRHFFQALLTAMVTFADPDDRQAALKLWGRLIDSIKFSSRVNELSHLARTCPFHNCVALIVDRLRADVVAHWEESIQICPAMVKLLADILKPTSNTEMIQRSDAIISALSFLRLLYLRDKTNVSGVHTDVSLVQQLKGQQRRIDDLVADQLSVEKSRRESNLPSTSSQMCMTMTTDNEEVEDFNCCLMRLQLLQASFQAVMATITSLA